MAEFSFWLPFPPSVNRIWRVARGKPHLSPQYVEWKQRADAAAQQQKLGRGPVLGRCSADIRLSTAFRRNGDLDNRVKAILDWCQRVGVIVEDRYVDTLSVLWDEAIDHDCTVTLRGEVAFVDRWEFARHQAEKARKRAKARVTASASRGYL